MIKKIRSYFETLKSRPAKEQKFFALAVSGGLTFIIVSSSVVLPSSTLRASEKIPAEAAAAKSVASPFSLLKNEAAQAYANLRDNPAVDEIKGISSLFMKNLNHSASSSRSTK